jgi:ring-1,2-phenylacetyl-CoA epoxidase subunit PaaD
MVKEISTDTIWGILKTIPDPEIPTVSIVELGIIRDVQYVYDMFNITITPTYIGCPAMSFIEEEIIYNMESQGVINYQIKTSLAPPWTTDWMSEGVKAKLKDAGIAPPSKNVICPQCDSMEVEVISNFGSTACKALYKCLSCAEPFHHFKQF